LGGGPGEGFLGKAIDKVGPFAIKATNNNTYVSELSHLYWESTEPIEFNIRTKLVAEQSAEEEIMNKISLLSSLVLPRRSDSFLGINTERFGVSLLKSPPRDISLQMGSKLRFRSVVIKNVNPTFQTMCDKDGNFVVAEVDIGISTSYIPSAEDFSFAKEVVEPVKPEEGRRMPWLGDTSLLR
jgi:hypothetical protein